MCLRTSHHSAGERTFRIAAGIEGDFILGEGPNLPMAFRVAAG